MKFYKKLFRDYLPEYQKKISEGNEKAFEQLYHLYYKKLIHFSENYTKSKELAEEVVEDVFIKIWANREKIVSINNLNVYLYTAVKHQSLNALSKEARRIVTEILDLNLYDTYEENHSPHDLLVTSELMQSVQSAIDSLPPRCKLIFQLVREDQLKYKEIAEILGVSVSTIDTQVAIAVKRICASLKIKIEKRTSPK